MIEFPIAGAQGRSVPLEERRGELVSFFDMILGDEKFVRESLLHGTRRHIEELIQRPVDQKFVKETVGSDVPLIIHLLHLSRKWVLELLGFTREEYQELIIAFGNDEEIDPDETPETLLRAYRDFQRDLGEVQEGVRRNLKGSGLGLQWF